MRTTRRFHRLASALAAVSVAGLAGLGTAAPSAAQEDDGTPAPPDTTPSTVPAPDDRGVVHSWGLAPGDGTLEAGDRPNLSYELPPGGEAQDMVTLFNYSNVPLTFDVYATDAFNNADGTFDLLPADEQPTGVGTWFDLADDADITLAPGTQASFPVTIRIPVDARPGDHAGAILAASPALGTSPDGDTVTLDRRTGTRVYVRVTGPLRPELAVEGLSTTYTPDLNPGGGAAEVTYRIVNRGNVRLATTHRVSVSGPFGLLRRSLDAEEIVELLPGEEIEFTRTIDGVAATGLLSTSVDLDPQAVTGDELEVDHDDGRSFGLAIPFTIVALLLVALLAWYARRAYLRHANGDARRVGGDGMRHRPA